MLAAYRGLAKFAGGFSHLSGAVLGWRQAKELFHAAARSEAPARVALPETEPLPQGSGAVLEAVDLAFQHPRRGRPVLAGCHLRVEPGDRILLEGASGSGKSTLAAVLAGLREPGSGLVLLHGFDSHTLGGAAWRRRVALAPQFHENHVFTETFAFNLLMGRDWPPTPDDLDEAAAVCRELGLGGLLDRRPSGLQQIVGESGWQLSHGERSRLHGPRPPATRGRRGPGRKLRRPRSGKPATGARLRPAPGAVAAGDRASLRRLLCASASEPVAIIYSLTGKDSLATPDAARRPLRLFDRIPAEPILKVGPGSRLALAFANGLRYELSKDEALRAAQVDLVRSKSFAHPFHWAAFQLTGDWR